MVVYNLIYTYDVHHVSNLYFVHRDNNYDSLKHEVSDSTSALTGRTNAAELDQSLLRRDATSPNDWRRHITNRSNGHRQSSVPPDEFKTQKTVSKSRLSSVVPLYLYYYWYIAQLNIYLIFDVEVGIKHGEQLLLRVQGYF